MLREMYVPHVMSKERIEQHTCAITQKLSQTCNGVCEIGGGGAAIERNHGPTISTSIMKIQDNPPNGSVVRRFFIAFFQARIAPRNNQSFFKTLQICF